MECRLYKYNLDTWVTEAESPRTVRPSWAELPALCCPAHQPLVLLRQGPVELVPLVHLQDICLIVPAEIARGRSQAWIQ